MTGTRTRREWLADIGRAAMAMAGMAGIGALATRRTEACARASFCPHCPVASRCEVALWRTRAVSKVEESFSRKGRGPQD
ncbi:MAG: hypothetical protein RMJ43_11995 [Chloroherpetonaceae bacterium]|nr:hypothetical protein [Chthonomonadaceae bacterium]MDW8208548.1 hypothetical protein [Chloroherpetonaceae bacterium]